MQRLDHFMGDALTHYYKTRDPLGVDGDFTTAPEISQLFGEIIGVWAVQQWIKLGSPPSFNLIEIGPGRGTLMADLLRGTSHISDFHNPMDIHLIETSATLTEKQKATLKNYNIEWHNDLSNIKTDKPSIIIANEFFDALPIRQFKFQDNQWLEHYIDDDKPIWVEVNNPPIKQKLPPPTDGDIFEYSDAQKNYAEILSKYHGATLIIDYGYVQSSYGDSLQALYKHAPCVITDHIGEADLTSHIDFEWLSSFFKKTQIKTQREFLKENGIDIRYQSLNNADLKSGYDRLLDMNQMGNLFKVLETFTQKA